MVIYIKPVLLFIYGYVIGMLLAFLVFTTKHPEKVFIKDSRNIVTYNTTKLSTDLLKYNQFVNNNGNVTLSYDKLKHQVVLLCIMLVKNIDNAYVSSNTWMWKCNHQLYFGAKRDNYLKIEVLNYSNSWHSLCSVFQFLFHSFHKTYHWVVFSKDNDFVIPDNLRQLVFSSNYSKPMYLGHNAFIWNVLYNSGQSSFVISKGTVDVLMKKFKSKEECINYGYSRNMEDYYLGKSLAQLGVYPTDTRDDQGRQRFHVAPLNFLFMPEETGSMPDFEPRSVYKEVQGTNCCSSSSISFPVSSVSTMYFYSYLLYVVRIRKDAGMLTSASTYDDVWKNFVLEIDPKANLSAITAQKYYDMWNDIIDPPTIFNQKLRQLFLRHKDDS